MQNHHQWILIQQVYFWYIFYIFFRYYLNIFYIFYIYYYKYNTEPKGQDRFDGDSLFIYEKCKGKSSTTKLKTWIERENGVIRTWDEFNQGARTDFVIICGSYQSIPQSLIQKIKEHGLLGHVIKLKWLNDCHRKQEWLHWEDYQININISNYDNLTVMFISNIYYLHII